MLCVYLWSLSRIRLYSTLLQENRDINIFTAGSPYLEHDQNIVDTHLRFGGSVNGCMNECLTTEGIQGDGGKEDN